MNLTKAQIASWRKRVATIHKKSELLMSDAINLLGVEDLLTDEIDNILVATADTLSHLDRRSALAAEGREDE